MAESTIRRVNIRADDSPSIDAFGRWRTSHPETIFDSKNIFKDPDLPDTVENLPLYYDNQETSGSGTGTTYDNYKASQTLTVSNTTAGTRVRQTKMRFNYQSGKSALILLTFNLNGTAPNIIKRIGYFDENNGLLLETSGNTVNFIRRTNVTGTPTDNTVAQSNWNLDPMDGSGPSEITLDFTKTQIMFIDFEWLGVGRVRMGFVVDGKIYYAHEFNNTNNLDVVYMSTPNLPIRCEITNDGAGAAESITQICSTVISEGGNTDLGSIRYASTSGTHIVATSEDVAYAVLGIRLKPSYIGATIKILNAAVQIQSATDKIEWFLVGNPTVTTSLSASFQNQPYSAVQIARGTGSNVITGGIQWGGGFAESGGTQTGAAGSTASTVNNSILLGSTISGTPDEVYFCVRPIGGSTSVNVEASLIWREIT